MDSADYTRFMALAKESADGCLLWEGTVAHGRPTFHPTGKSTHSARLLYFEHTEGHKPEAVKVTCGNSLCIRHLTPRARQSPSARAASRRHYINKVTGRSLYGPVARARARVVSLQQDHGMSYRRIGELSGVSAASLSEMAKGRWRRMLKTDEAAILAVVPDVTVVGRGAPQPIEPTRRRLQALCADGYGSFTLAPLLGMGSVTVHRLMKGGYASCPDRVPAATAAVVAGLYAKLDGVDPADMGLTPFQVAYSRSTARKNSYAPRHCWDDDTIGDPDAFPEWTGQCGTEAGYDIHRREGHIFPGVRRGEPYEYLACPVCRTAIAAIRRAENARRRIRTQGDPS